MPAHKPIPPIIKLSKICVVELYMMGLFMVAVGLAAMQLQRLTSNYLKGHES
jgi:hypothetical protein